MSWVPAFLVVAAVWGFSFLFMELGLRALPPVGVAFWRIALGAAALLLLCAASRTALPRAPRTLWHLLVVALLLNAVPFTLFAYGQTHVSSVLAAIINAATPLSTLAVILLAFREERPTPQRILGLLIGFAGVLVVLGVWRGLGAGEWSGVLACLAAISCYGIAIPYSRRHLGAVREGPLALVTVQTGLAALCLLPFALASGGTDGPLTAAVVGGMLALGVLGTGVAFVLSFHVVRVAGSTTASTVTYLIPLVALAASAVFLDEPIEAHQLVGGAVVLLGAAVGQGLVRLPARGRPHAV
jgi:drug/metabolite transporter (DMT)-like permease